MIKICKAILLALMVLIGPLVLSQSNISVVLQSKEDLNGINYSNYEHNKFSSSGIDFDYYIEGNATSVLLRNVSNNQVVKEVPVIRSAYVFVCDFLVKDTVAYFLYSDGLYAFDLTKPVVKDREAESLRFIKLDKVYDEIDVVNDTIVLSTFYNRYSDMEKEIACSYLTMALKSFDVVIENELHIDAIGFSHLPSYFISVSNNSIAISNCLKNEIQLFDFKSKEPTAIIGDGKLLNKQLDKIPFDTRIMGNVNTRKIVSEISAFGQTVNRNEGVFFLNDSTLVLVEKKKKSSKRLLHIYENVDSKWIYNRTFKFKNGALGYRKYGFLYFHTSPQFICKNNLVYILNGSTPNEINGSIEFLRYNQRLKKSQDVFEHPISVYCYEIKY